MRKKKIGKHLKFYMDCMENEQIIPYFGLCYSIQSEHLKLFYPTKEDEDKLREEGKSILYWGADIAPHWEYDKIRFHGFTALRQTIVLFMAAIAGEL